MQKLLLMKREEKTTAESHFRDQLIQQIIQKYGVEMPKVPTALIGYRTLHGSKAFEYNKRSRITGSSKRGPGRPTGSKG